MADLEPGVTLSASTIAAMERLSTPSRTAMTKPHQATPDDWAQQEDWANRSVFSDSSCIIELRGRVAALEAAQRSAWRPVATETTYGDARADVEQTIRAPMVVEGTFEHGGETYRFKAKPERETAMDEPREASLVERVANAIYNVPHDSEAEARAAILEVAAWMSKHPFGKSWAMRLEQEANR